MKFDILGIGQGILLGRFICAVINLPLLFILRVDGVIIKFGFRILLSSADADAGKIIRSDKTIAARPAQKQCCFFIVLSLLLRFLNYT